MSKKINLNNLIGKKYGRLTILSAVREKRGNDKHNKIYVTCECECGTIKDYRYQHLQKGSIQSCKCLLRESASINNCTHNSSNTRLYNIYNHMKNRCYNKNDLRYKDWGGRGITICDEWLNNFAAFQEWALSHGYQDDLTIDRIDNDKNYCPENCRWTTYKKQANNKRNNYYITINNETKTLSEWCELYNIVIDVVTNRINQLKWDPLKALTTPIQVQNRNNINDKQRLHKIWENMKQRCYNQNHPQYKNYGARNITIYTEWINNFDNFYDWAINNGYNNTLSLGRININSNYEPDNCKWMTAKEQANNTRNNKYIIINEEIKTLSEWCEIYNINYKTVKARINQLHWDPLKALTTPIKRK